MSQENVGIIKRVYDAYRRGDFEACLSYFDSGVEFSQPTEQPGAGTYHGHEGIIQAMTKWIGAWDDYRVRVEELTAFGDHVLARTRHHGRGKGSGVEVEQQIVQLYTFRDRKIVRTRMYYDEGEALEAVGRRE